MVVGVRIDIGNMETDVKVSNVKLYCCKQRCWQWAEPKTLALEVVRRAAAELAQPAQAACTHGL